jgi:uncharacterized protein with NAD-binding domain and iron-sulfur cluster
MTESRCIEVAVVGGGCAAVAAAFELTRPEHRGRYHVTMYVQGWRLGGKGASGRGPAGRIEEHGFHVWLGFYENAFRLLRECYAERNLDGKPRRFADWRDAFLPSPRIGLAERSPNGAWSAFMAQFPGSDGTPGDPLSEGNPYTVVGYLRRTASLLRTLLVACQEPDDSTAARADASAAPSAPPTVAAVIEGINRLLKYGVLATMAGLIEAAGLLEVVARTLTGYPDSVILKLLDAIGANARRQLEGLAERDDEVRRLWEIIDIVLATMRGIIRCGLAADARGFDAIDDYDCRDWLREHGASQRSLDSAFVRGLHALAFAHVDGDFDRPSLAAGAALRGSLRMFFTYRGALFWKMRAGMGDVVFAPFYEVLRKRGVAFRFFHRVEKVRLADPSSLAAGERPYVSALEIDVQAEVRDGREYEPLVDVQGLPCWPSRPDHAQLVEGERLARENRDFESFWERRKVAAKTLRVVDDFDFVVLGVGVGAIPHLCPDILARDQRWRDMVAHVKTTATQAFQVWLREDVEALGWNHPLSSLSGFAQPFDTWADMAHLIPQEGWSVRPRALAYFCSVLPDLPDAPDGAYAARRNDEVRQNAIRFLERDIGHLWPRALRAGGGFRWDLLVDPSGVRTDGNREAAFASQFWKANVNPSDRYTLSLPGSARYRISPLDNTYDNLTIAGDWTSCGHNTGCVEAAVMSGRLAAHAISQSPPLESIIGYDHP